MVLGYPEEAVQETPARGLYQPEQMVLTTYNTRFQMTAPMAAYRQAPAHFAHQMLPILPIHPVRREHPKYKQFALEHARQTILLGTRFLMLLSIGYTVARMVAQQFSLPQQERLALPTQVVAPEHIH